MSDIKQKSKSLKEICKKYGYDIKHTHALEIISQLDNGVNRHAALTKEKKSNSLELNFDNAPIGVNSPFYQAYVLEVTGDDELVNFIIVDEKHPYLEVDLLFDLPNIKAMRFMTEKEVSSPGFNFRLEEADDALPFNTLLSWIEDTAKTEKVSSFVLPTKND